MVSPRMPREKVFEMPPPQPPPRLPIGLCENRPFWWTPAQVDERPTPKDVIRELRRENLWSEGKRLKIEKCLDLLLSGRRLFDRSLLQQFCPGNDPTSTYTQIKIITAGKLTDPEHAAQDIEDAAMAIVVWVTCKLRKPLGIGIDAVVRLSVADDAADHWSDDEPVASCRFTPPPSHVQDARCCQNISALTAYLKSAQASTDHGKKRRHVDFTRREGDIVFDRIRQWANTEEGRRHLVEACNLSPDSFQIDHAIPRELGGPTHLANAHLMEGSVNAYFNNRFDKEKKTFIGEKQVHASLSVMRWMKTRCDWENWSPYNC